MPSLLLFFLFFSVCFFYRRNSITLCPCYTKEGEKLQKGSIFFFLEMTHISTSLTSDFFQVMAFRNVFSQLALLICMPLLPHKASEFAKTVLLKPEFHGKPSSHILCVPYISPPFIHTVLSS